MNMYVFDAQLTATVSDYNGIVSDKTLDYSGHSALIGMLITRCAYV